MVATKIGKVVDLVVGGEKALHLLRRLEALHLLFSSSRRLVWLVAGNEGQREASKRAWFKRVQAGSAPLSQVLTTAYRDDHRLILTQWPRRKHSDDAAG
jgi:hypothetical protein